MKAAAYHRYGPPEVVRVIDAPTLVPGDSDVLVRVRATTVTTGDWRARSLQVPSALFWLPARLVFGLARPRRAVLGMDLAGDVAAVGSAVTSFAAGDRVFGVAGMAMGAHAEYVRLPAAAVLAPMPANLTFEEAAAVPFAGLTALYFVRDLGRVRPGQRVMVHGASGGIGVFAVQLARHFGAEVTGVCSAANVELVKSLGADHVLDYTAGDFTRTSQRFDVVFDTVGKTSFARCRHLLAPQGRFLATVLTGTELWQMLWTALRGGKRVVGGVTDEKLPDLLFLKELLEAGSLRPVIDSRYPLQDIVAAHRRVDTGRKRGSVVVTMDHQSR